jgi:NAD(P)-dependent dehydrogenase (short-subunit alcohol dehydrogenase family)
VEHRQGGTPAPRRQQQRAIILTSSLAGLKGLPNSVHYNAAKHGVVGIMRSIANEFGQYNIRVNSVSPSSCDQYPQHPAEIRSMCAPARQRKGIQPSRSHSRHHANPMVVKDKQPVRPHALSVQPAEMTRIIALTALTTLGLSGGPLYEPVHSRGAHTELGCPTGESHPGDRGDFTVRSDQRDLFGQTDRGTCDA